MGCGSSASAQPPTSRTNGTIPRQRPVLQDRATSMTSVLAEFSSTDGGSSINRLIIHDEHDGSLEDGEVQEEMSRETSIQTDPEATVTDNNEELRGLMKVYDITAELNESLEERNNMLVDRIREQQETRNQLKPEVLERHLGEMARIRAEVFSETAQQDIVLRLLLGNGEKYQEMRTDIENDIQQLDIGLVQILRERESVSPDELNELLRVHRDSQEEVIRSLAAHQQQEGITDIVQALNVDIIEAMREDEEKLSQYLTEKDKHGGDVDQILQGHLANVRSIRAAKFSQRARLDAKLLALLGSRKPDRAEDLEEDLERELTKLDEELQLALSRDITSANEVLELVKEYHKKQGEILTSRAVQTSSTQGDASIDDFTTKLYDALQSNDAQMVGEAKKGHAEAQEMVGQLLHQHLLDMKSIRAQKLSEKSRLDEKLKVLIGDKKREEADQYLAEDIEDDIEKEERRLARQLQEDITADDVDSLLEQHRYRQAEIIRTRAIHKSKLDDKLKQKLLERRKRDITEVSVGKEELVVEQLHDIKRASSLNDKDFLHILRSYMSDLPHDGDDALSRERTEDIEETSKILKDNEKHKKMIRNLRAKEKTLLDLKLNEKKKKKKNKEDSKTPSSDSNES